MDAQYKRHVHQRCKCSKSTRLPQFLNLTTKTKEFCETPFKNGKLNAELTASYQCVLRFFHSICLKYCACHEKAMPSHIKCCTCHAKSSSQTCRSDAPKCNPSQEISGLTSCVFLTLLSSKIEEVSQNCFVFDVVSFKKLL